MRTFVKICTIINFQKYYTVLTILLIIVIVLYIKSLELTHLPTGNLHSLITFTHSLPSPKPLATTNFLFLWVQFFKIPHVSEITKCPSFSLWLIYFSSVQFSRSVVSDSLWPHDSQHARPPCPSPTPGVHSHSRASSQWCHPAISSSVVLFSSCPQSLPASESFPMSQLFTWGGQSTGVSALPSFLPKKS